MPSDAERWRFLSDHLLMPHTDGGDYGYMVHWCRTAGPGSTAVRIISRKRLATNVAARGDYSQAILGDIELKLK